MNDIEWLEPWKAVEDGGFFEAELQREVGPGHLLCGVEVQAIGQRLDCDDVLFALTNHSHALAVVHLTCSAEPNPQWPQTRLFARLEDWMERDMEPNNRDFWGDNSV